MSTLCFVMLLIFNCHQITVPQNVSFRSYSPSLPTQLANHTSVTFNNTIHFIGGVINHTTPNKKVYTLSFTANQPITSNNNAFIEHDIFPNISFDIYPGISCGTQCSVQINELLYIVQATDSQGLVLLIYDMIATNYRNLSTYNYVADWHSSWADTPPNIGLGDTCVVADDVGEYLFVISSKNLSPNFLTYSIPNDEWDNFWVSFLNGWIVGRGCFFFDAYLYALGGIETDEWDGSYGTVLKYIEKVDMFEYINEIKTLKTCNWNAGTSCAGSVFVRGELAFARSHFKIIQITENYFAIFGGTADKNNDKYMEIFNANSEEMLTAANGPIEVNFDLSHFDAVYWNDYLLVYGGIDSDDNVKDEIYYIDTSTLLSSTEKVFDFSCITRYNVASTNRSIDEYLLKSGGVVAEILEEGMSDFKISINSVALRGFWVSMSRSNLNGGSIQYTTVEIEFGIESVEEFYFEANMEQISDLRNINMLHNRTVIWMRWDAEIGQSGYAVDVPYWRMGYGDKYDRFNMRDFETPTDPNYVGYPLDTVFMADVVSMEVYNASFQFYTDSCSIELEILQIDINLHTFNVGDYLAFNWSLHEATSLNVPIIITCDLMVDFEYKMYVLEDACLLCKDKIDDECLQCEQGVEIADLKTYDIRNNVYEIYVSSEFENLYIANNPTVLSRNIMEVEIFMDVETGALFPNVDLFITVVIGNVSVPSQANGSITITFDQDLGFENNNQALLFIDFYNESCVIFYNDDSYESMECLLPILIPETMHFKPIKQNNYAIAIESDNINLIGDTSFSFNRKVQTIDISFSSSLYLGQVIQVFYTILDDEIYQSLSTINVVSSGFKIDSIIRIDHGANLTNNPCEIETFDAIAVCESGIELQAGNIQVVGSNINLLLQSDDTYLAYNTSNILIDECPVGLGLSENSNQCSGCEEHQVGILRNSQCMLCSDITGVECLGSSNIKVQFNHWIAVNNGIYDEQYFHGYNNDESNMISAFCASGICCQQINGCIWNFTQLQNTALCAPNRDPTVPLCGACLPGYSEVFGSSACKECDSNHYELLLYPLLISLLVIFGFIYFESDIAPKLNQTQKQEINYKKYLALDDLAALQICLFRSLTYFFQAITFITLQTGFFFYLTPVMRILAFDFVFESNDSGAGICFVKNMKSIEEELWVLFFPVCMFLSLGIFAIFNFIVKRKCDLQSNETYMKMSEKLSFGWNLVMKIFLIVIGNIISKMLKILACSRIGKSHMVHFYGGYLVCFGGVWVISLMVLVCIIIFWFVIWYLLYKINTNQRESRSFYLRTITKPYKVEFWYWEIILISRRVLLAFLVTFQYISYHLIRYILLILLVSYLCLHFRCYPFRYQRANRIEAVCLFLLIVCLVIIIILFDTTTNGIFVSFVMSIVVLIPIIIFIIYIIFSIKHYFDIKKETQLFNDKSKLKIKIEKMRERMTVSQQLLFDDTTPNNAKGTVDEIQLATILEGDLQTNLQENAEIITDDNIEITEVDPDKNKNLIITENDLEEKNEIAVEIEPEQKVTQQQQMGENEKEKDENATIENERKKAKNVVKIDEKENQVGLKKIDKKETTVKVKKINKKKKKVTDQKQNVQSSKKKTKNTQKKKTKNTQKKKTTKAVDPNKSKKKKKKSVNGTKNQSKKKKENIADDAKEKNTKKQKTDNQYFE